MPDPFGARPAEVGRVPWAPRRYPNTEQEESDMSAKQARTFRATAADPRLLVPPWGCSECGCELPPWVGDLPRAWAQWDSHLATAHGPSSEENVMGEAVTEVEVPRTPGVHLVLSDEDMETLRMLLDDAWAHRLASFDPADRVLFERYRAFAFAHGLGAR